MPKIRLKRILFYIVSIFLLIVLSFLVWFKYATKIEEPVPNDKSSLYLKRTQIGKDAFICGDSWLRKSESGLWEMYVSGAPFERGAKMGILSKELIQYQENAFINQIDQMIPSRTFLYFLKYFIQFFNRNIDRYIPREYLEEIYGVSQFASDGFDFIGSKYERILNYHAAHDIGHALQNMKMVGCTSFSAWNSKTEQNDLIVGRNFDFFVGEEFAKNKIICFMQPDKGYKFAFITWGGMIGVTSGMNEKGLTVTINAAKSDIPGGAKTPISILVRQILQYSRNINDAVKIAKLSSLFVSESILIGSAEDNKSAIIEATPNHDNPVSVYYPNEDYLICSNHFQSKEKKDSKLNREFMDESSTIQRFKRVNQLLHQDFPLNYLSAASILRDRFGLDSKEIGLGNEQAINQLLAHHSVIFEPKKLLLWVSTDPFQLGKYVCYDLNQIFSLKSNNSSTAEIYEKKYEIPADTLLNSVLWQNFKHFRRISKDLQHKKYCNDSLAGAFIATNPEYFETYRILGDYYADKGNNKRAIYFFNEALKKVIPNKSEVNSIKEKIIKISKTK